MLCPDKTKATTKTINLCNNPEYKMKPKVSIAKHIIGMYFFKDNWIELDAEMDKYEKGYLTLTLV